MSESKSKPLLLPAPLKVFLFVTVLLSAFTWIFALICSLRHLPIFYSLPYELGDFGGDFRDYRHLFEHLHSMAFFPATGARYFYPAPLAVFYHVLFALWGKRPHCLLILWAFIALAVCAATLILYRAMRRRGISFPQAAAFCVLTVVLSYTLQYELLRSNVEVAIWVVLIAAMWAYRTGRMWLAGVFLGIAIACKWYPAILLGLCLRKKTYKVIPIALVICALVTIVSDIWLGPTFRIAATETRRGAQTFLDIFAKGYIAVGYDHSFFAFYKVFTHLSRPNLGRALKVYMLLAGVGASVLYFVRIHKLPVINQIVLLFILSITLPPVSFDYTLLHLYTCWAIFTLYVLDRYGAGENVPMANWVMFWFAFAMAAHGYVVRHGYRYSAQMRLIGLVALLYLFLKYPFPEPEDTPALREIAPAS